MKLLKGMGWFREKNETAEKAPQKSYGKIFSVPVQNPRRIPGLYTEEFSGLTSKNIKIYIEAARMGLNFYKGLLFEEIRKRDLHIGGVCQSRKRAVVGKKYNIICEWEEGKEMAEKILGGLDFIRFASNILEAELQGVSLFEIDYGVVEGKVLPVKQRRIPNYLYLYDDIEDEYKLLDVTQNDGYNLRMIASMASTGFEDRVNLLRLKMVDVSPDKILEVESIDSDNANGFRNGCIDAILWGYFLKNYGLKDYSVYLELFGNPMRVGKYDEIGVNDKLMREFRNAIKEMGNLAYAVIPKSFEIEFPGDSNKASTTNLFDKYLQYIDDAISVRVLGQTLTTKIGEKGSYSAAQVHKTVKEEVEQSDMKLVEMTINELIARVMKMNYSKVPEMPRFEYISEEGVDIKKTKAETIKLIKESGFMPSREYVTRETGVELEDEKPEISKSDEKEDDEKLEKFIEKFINK